MKIDFIDEQESVRTEQGDEEAYRDFVRQIIKRFQIERKKHDRSGVYALTQRMMAYNSNKIEGSTLNQEQTASLFNTGTITADGEVFIAKDVEEMTGHFMMFNEMLNTYNRELTHEIIKLYHFRLKSGVWEDHINGYAIGKYKRRSNMVGTIQTVQPSEVEKYMSLLLKEYNSKEKHAIDDIAKFHALYEKIHPFQDGNGRTGRMIVFKECLKNEIIPVIITDSIKIEYYEALKEAQTNENYRLLIDLMKRQQKKYYELVKDFVIEYEE